MICIIYKRLLRHLAGDEQFRLLHFGCIPLALFLNTKSVRKTDYTRGAISKYRYQTLILHFNN